MLPLLDFRDLVTEGLVAKEEKADGSILLKPDMLGQLDRWPETRGRFGAWGNMQAPTPQKKRLRKTGALPSIDPPKAIPA
ncbi:MAG: hypothetical protein K2X57_16950, partial [Xanthobacteraceae bacterium]|nr:hypothetical protein [Xanthobacteraceae bacterium]